MPNSILVSDLQSTAFNSDQLVISPCKPITQINQGAKRKNTVNDL